MKELEDRNEYNTISGVGGDIQPDATDLDIATGVLTGDGAEAERIEAENIVALETAQRIENERAARVREEAAQRDREDAANRAAAERAAAQQAAARAAAAQAVNRHRGDGGGGGGGPPSQGGAPTGTAGRNPWGRARGGLIRKPYGKGGIVDLL